MARPGLLRGGPSGWRALSLAFVLAAGGLGCQARQAPPAAPASAIPSVAATTNISAAPSVTAVAPSSTAPPTAAPSPTVAPSPTAAATATPSVNLAAVKPNELGKVVVLEYHDFGDTEERWT